VLSEVISHTPEEVLVHIAKAMTLTRQQEHIEALIVADKGINNAESTTWVYVLIDIAMYEQQVTLHAVSNRVVSRDVIHKYCLTMLINLLDTIVLLAPSAVVNVVIVVTCAR
jgi:aspartate carbamoyltransferase regulatory subunit